MELDARGLRTRLVPLSHRPSPRMSPMAETLADLVRDTVACATLESLACRKGVPILAPQRSRRRTLTTVCASKPPPFDTHERVKGVVQACQRERKRRAALDPSEDLSDARLSKLARFTDAFDLSPYEPFLHFLPRLVNVVTLAEAVPMVGSGLEPAQPLDLARIAAKCSGAYFAPKRFAAVQLAYTNPRCRILVFHTGRLVGTGCQSTIGARLAIARAQRQLSQEAGVHLHVRNFAVINTVGACNLRATINCEAFADAHRAESHFDRSSFVGLAWRPPGESCCVEIYSTGRANLPGSRTERALHTSFARMMPELLRFSSSARLLEHIPEELQAAHRPTDGSCAPPAATSGSEAPSTPTAPELTGVDLGGVDDDALAALGF